MSPYRDSRWTKTILIVFFLVLIGYAYFEMRGLLFGPILDIPTNITTSHEQFIQVSGKAERIVSLAMNGREITVTEDGDFTEPYLLAPGLNRITFDAKDKYGHITSRNVEIMYVPESKNADRLPSPTAPNDTGSSTSPLPATAPVKNTTTSKSVERQ